jgi:hypothetical protein
MYTYMYHKYIYIYIMYIHIFITGGGRLMRLDMLLEWKEVKELFDEGVITPKQVSKMFDGMARNTYIHIFICIFT